eukprot:1801299-Rhodomonas_salina.2
MELAFSQSDGLRAGFTSASAKASAACAIPGPQAQSPGLTVEGFSNSSWKYTAAALAGPAHNLPLAVNRAVTVALAHRDWGPRSLRLRDALLPARLEGLRRFAR